ncbi:MAG: hypothetical protein Q8P03_00905 [bacterium]|nr:hypothetical protein [bacterium]
MAPTTSQKVLQTGRKWSTGIAKGGALAGASGVWRKYGDKLSRPTEKLTGLGTKVQKWGQKQTGLGTIFGKPATFAGWGTQRFAKTRLVKGVGVGAGLLQKRVTVRDATEIAAAEKESAAMGDSKLVANQFNKELLKGPAVNRNKLIGYINGMIKNGDADDLQDYIENGLMDGKVVGRAIIEGRKRIGPNGYRTIIKGLGGMIYTDPTKLGWGVQKSTDGQPLTDKYGSIKIQGRSAAETDFLENTVKREIVEKLKPGEISEQGFLGNYVKNFHQEKWKKGGEILAKRFVQERGGTLLGALLKTPEQAVGRQQLGDVVQDHIDTQFGFDPEKTNQTFEKVPDEYFNALASAGKYMYSSGAASAGIVGGYRKSSADVFNKAARDDIQRRAAKREGTPPGGTGPGGRPEEERQSGGPTPSGWTARPSGLVTPRPPEERRRQPGTEREQEEENQGGGPTGDTEGATRRRRRPPEEEVRGGPTPEQ